MLPTPRKIDQADPTQPADATVQREDRRQVILLGHRHRRHHVGANVTERTAGLKKPIAAARLPLEARVEQIESELGVPKLVFRDVAHELGKDGLPRLLRHAQKKIRREVLAHHISRQLGHGIVDATVHVTTANINELLVGERTVANDLEIAIERIEVLVASYSWMENTDVASMSSQSARTRRVV